MQQRDAFAQWLASVDRLIANALGYPCETTWDWYDAFRDGLSEQEAIYEFIQWALSPKGTA
jgi:hypothetical protein